MLPHDDRVSAKPLLDKLGVKPDHRVALIGQFPDWFDVLLTQRVRSVTERLPAEPIDMVFVAADSHAELEILSELRARIVPNGAIWIVSRKGKAATLRDVDVIAAALNAGLVDNKVVSFSDSHTALRLVIRVRDRL